MKNYKSLVLVICILVGILIIFIVYPKLRSPKQDPLSSTADTADFDLRQKCASDAEKIFNRDWVSTNPTSDISLTYSNHYNKTQNKCYMLVSYNFWVTEKFSIYGKSQTFYDVEDNLKLGELMVTNDNGTSEPSVTKERVTACYVFGKNCLSADDFSLQIKPYISN